MLWFCQFMVMVGMSAVIPFLPLLVRQLGVTDIKQVSLWSGLIFAGPFFLSFFLAPIWGNLGDKHGRKIMIIRAIIGLACAQFLAAFTQNVTQLFLVRLFQGALSGFIPAAMSLAASNTPEEKTGYALGLLQSASAAGNVFGPFIGGVLFDLIGFRKLFFFVSGLLFLSGLLVLFFVKEENKGNGKSESSTLQNWKAIYTDKTLLYSSIMITAATLGFNFIRPIFVLFVESIKESQESLSTLTGVLFSIMGIFASFSSVMWGGKVKANKIRSNLVIAAGMTGLMYLGQTFIKNEYLLFPTMVVIGLGFGSILPLLFTVITKQTTLANRGGILGVSTSFQTIGNMIGPIIGGLAGGLFGFQFPFVVTALMFFSVSFIAYFFLPKEKAELVSVE
ncbi:MAG: MFS transporter [Bacteroidota bacterium]|nr:MFS transporter [Bacteroidota bacterium]